MVIFPLRPHPMNSANSEKRQPEQLEKPADILIVDDIPDNIRFLSSFLLEQGYQVRKAINGQMALTAIRTLTPDLILMDVNLPDMNGYDICRKLKENPSKNSCPIIFLSAANDAIDKLKAFQMGAADYITKPFHLEEVLSRIQTQLTIQRLQKELRIQNEHLQQTLEELKTARANLVQQGQMSTLRKVVSGVVRGINSPLISIASNIKPAQNHIKRLLSLIELYQQKYCSNLDPTIEALLKETDLEFITSDLNNNINSIENGAERMHAVILALQILTHLDESSIQWINLHESIESVLALLQHRLNFRRDNIRIYVKKEYGELPLIPGYPEQLKQAIFSILCNAFDAIDEKIAKSLYGNETPEVSIHTQLLDNNNLIISIKDNGIGIPEENKSHIFEPFFTTKSADYAVGLGLATSRRIIEEMHNGCLSYHSSTDEGSEFLIQIPVSIAVTPES